MLQLLRKYSSPVQVFIFAVLVLKFYSKPRRPHHFQSGILITSNLASSSLPISVLITSNLASSSLPIWHPHHFQSGILITSNLASSSLSIYMSSVLHLYFIFSNAFLSACLANICFSKPLDLFTPSHLYPGMIPNLLGGGGGPLYFGFSVKRQQYLVNR